jgi:beta-lactam-binding protein with PASTA domain
MKNFLRNSLLRKLLYIFLGLVLFFLIFDNLIMPWYVSSTETSVPKVVGLQVSEAISLLENDGFEIVISDTSYGLQVPVGAVFFQKPDAGAIV